MKNDSGWLLHAMVAMTGVLATTAPMISSVTDLPVFLAAIERISTDATVASACWGW